MHPFPCNTTTDSNYPAGGDMTMTDRRVGLECTTVNTANAAMCGDFVPAILRLANWFEGGTVIG